ncbi:MAG TPA: hypothetical protein PK809_14990 [Bacteroidia bacterium]|nr:hypothetical protein [Bacteroidia bacterium]
MTIEINKGEKKKIALAGTLSSFKITAIKGKEFSTEIYIKSNSHNYKLTLNKANKKAYSFPYLFPIIRQKEIVEIILKNLNNEDSVIVEYEYI